MGVPRLLIPSLATLSLAGALVACTQQAPAAVPESEVTGSPVAAVADGSAAVLADFDTAELGLMVRRRDQTTHALVLLAEHDGTCRRLGPETTATLNGKPLLRQHGIIASEIVMDRGCVGWFEGDFDLDDAETHANVVITDGTTTFELNAPDMFVQRRLERVYGRSQDPEAMTLAWTPATDRLIEPAEIGLSLAPADVVEDPGDPSRQLPLAVVPREAMSVNKNQVAFPMPPINHPGPVRISLVGTAYLQPQTTCVGVTRCAADVIEGFHDGLSVVTAPKQLTAAK